MKEGHKRSRQWNSLVGKKKMRGDSDLARD